jgi:hypothetical protein
MNESVLCSNDWTVVASQRHTVKRVSLEPKYRDSFFLEFDPVPAGERKSSKAPMVPDRSAQVSRRAPNFD